MLVFFFGQSCYITQLAADSFFGLGSWGLDYWGVSHTPGLKFLKDLTLLSLDRCLGSRVCRSHGIAYSAQQTITKLTGSNNYFWETGSLVSQAQPTFAV